jgi:hypothetical protein
MSREEYVRCTANLFCNDPTSSFTLFDKGERNNPTLMRANKYFGGERTRQDLNPAFPENIGKTEDATYIGRVYIEGDTF